MFQYQKKLIYQICDFIRKIYKYMTFYDCRFFQIQFLKKLYCWQPNLKMIDLYITFFGVYSQNRTPKIDYLDNKF